MTREELFNYVADMLGHEEAAQRIVNQLPDDYPRKKHREDDWALIKALMQEEIDA